MVNISSAICAETSIANQKRYDQYTYLGSQRGPTTGSDAQTRYILKHNFFVHDQISICFEISIVNSRWKLFHLLYTVFKNFDLTHALTLGEANRLLSNRRQQQRRNQNDNWEGVY